MTGYVAGTILVANFLAQKRLWLTLALGVNLIPAIALPLAYMNAESLYLPNGRLLAARYIGANALTDKIADTAEEHDRFLTGLTDLEARAQAAYGQPFAACQPGSRWLEPPPRPFW